MLLGLHAATSELSDGDRLCLLSLLLLLLGLLLLLLALEPPVGLSHCLLPGPVMCLVGLLMCIPCQSEVLLLALLPCPKLTVSAAGAAAAAAASLDFTGAGVGAVPGSALPAAAADPAAG
jgi:hypothetical protein